MSVRKVILSIAVILISIASCSKKTAPTASVNTALDGNAIFAKNCARCHGAQGVKDGRTPNLQTITLTQAELVKSITFGKRNMPAFEDKLSPQEISAVTDLIVSWHAK